MALRICWDKFEVALLIDACNQVREKKIAKSEMIHKLSMALRKRAIEQRIDIDEFFRNGNGISLQMTKMDYLLTNGKSGLPGASKLYVEMAELSKSNPVEFAKILADARAQIGEPEVKVNMSTKDLFRQYLSYNSSKKFITQTIIKALDESSDYCYSRNLSKVSFWDMTNSGEFTFVASKLLGMKSYRLTHKKIAVVLDKAVPLYKEFLKHKEAATTKITNIDANAEQENTIVKDTVQLESKNNPQLVKEVDIQALADKLYLALKSECDVNPYGAILTYLSQKVEASEKEVESILESAEWASFEEEKYKFEVMNDENQVLEYDFNNPASLNFTKPVKATYFGEIVSKATSWRKLLLDLLKVLHENYPTAFNNAAGVAYPPSNVPLIGTRSDLPSFRVPGEFVDEMYIELNRSANNILANIKRLLDICNADYENLVITYKKKQIERGIARDIKDKSEHIEENRSKVYQKLYSISKVYDDPTGMPINKIMSILGNGVDEPFVRDILNNASWAVKLSDNVYSFSGNTNVILKEQITPYMITTQNSVTDSVFFNYLHEQTELADTSCRSYVSAIRTAEEYAENNNYSSYKIYDCSFEDAAELIQKLLNDAAFMEFNIKQHNRFRAAFIKFLEMGGRIPTIGKKITSKSTKHIEHVKTQPKDFDKEKFEATLLRRYQNGMQFDSIDFENFRELYEMLYDEVLTFDDSALEDRLRYCGVIYKDRLFPAEGIIDSDTKEILFAYIENSFESGKKVLYYKAIYEDLADAFASCYTLSDENMLKAYIEYSLTSRKYYFFSNYMSVEKNVKVDHNTEVEEYFLSVGKPIRKEDVCTALSHIPQEQVNRIITMDSRFLRNAKGEYFHIGIFEITDDELECIADIINGFIDENEYAIWADVWNEIQDSMPVFLENNLYLSGLGVRNAIAQHYVGKFIFEGAVISLPKDKYAMKNVYQLYAKHHDEFTADDIYNLSKELDTVIYFDALTKVSVRVSHDLFVSKKIINFDVEMIDKTIESFMSKDYIRIREIDSFLAFPYVGYEWNEYLLESYLLSYSKNFTLLNNGLSLNNVAGAVVKKNGKIEEFVDACAAVLSESRIDLKKSEALNYLAEVNMITRRSYKELDIAIRKATQIRNRKE